MSDNRSSRTAAFVPSPEPLLDTVPAPKSLQAQPAPPRAVSLVTDSKSDPDAELTALLRRRLRQLVLVFLAAYAAFLFRDTLAPQRVGLHFQKVMFLIVTPLQLALAALTWSPWANTTSRLRIIELSVLGVCWVTVGGIQFDWLWDWEDAGYYLHGERHIDGQILVANTWVVPWFALIAGYPVVVPNPVRR